MPNENAAIVRILGSASEAKGVFQGTGLLVTANWVLTCKHVALEKDFYGRPTQQPWPYLLVESAAGQSMSVHRAVPAQDWEPETGPDLALLELTAPLFGDIPLFLTRVTQDVDPWLRRASLVILGYARDEPLAPPGYHTVGQLLLSRYGGDSGLLESFQFAGGLPKGCSGSPVLLPWGTRWVYVGTAYLGSEQAATSRAIAADIVMVFLVQTGLQALEQVEAAQVLGPDMPVAPEDPVQRPTSLAPLPNPYRWLEAFRESDAPYFYGRDAEIQQILDKVRQWPFVALVGPSGSGKSSLVSAGVVPRLRQNPHWLIAACRPALNPFEELAQALAPLLYPALDKKQQKAEGERLTEELTSSTERRTVAEVIARLAQDTPDKRLVLIVDQFEELYTQPILEDRKHLFLENLRMLVQGELPCSVLITLRADFLGQVLSPGAFADFLNAYPPMFLEPMSEERLRQAIEKPAKLVEVTLQVGLAELILRDLGQEPGTLPLLQFALAKLWERRQGKWLTHTAYRDIGGVHKALIEHANAVLADIGGVHKALIEHAIAVLADFPGEVQRLRRIFVQLVRPGEQTEHTRQVATRPQVGETNWPLVLRLADHKHRLVVTGRNNRGEETVEIVHEVLIRRWPILRQWMEQDGEFRKWQNRMRLHLQEWERSGDPGTLLRGKPLEEAEEKLQHHAEELDPRERDYIAASIQQHDREREERERLHQRQSQALLLAVVPLFAGLIGALTRMPLSWLFGSFIDLPVIGSESAPELGEILEPAWNGFFGTFVGGIYIVGASELFLRDQEKMTLWQTIALALSGVLWGLSIVLIISVAFTPDSLRQIGWYTHNIRFGYVITGTFWGLGIAIGTYLGNSMYASASYFSNIFYSRLWGGIGGVLCLSLVSPLVVSYFFQQKMEYQSLMQRSWADAFEQAISVWAILTCLYWLKQRLASTWATVEPASQ